ncbi:MAG: sulfate/thiosulfate ABC transporter permease CysW, partial [Nitrospirae bacterium]|nr:sulfate/thiosulfate ABC transporter permease CysW [Nitrospirota bacterium]
EILYNEYDFVGAFSVASLLILVAVATIGVKALVEWKYGEAGNPAVPERRGTL